jgi:hypothetical protein
MSKEEYERHARTFQRMAAETTDEGIREQLINIANEWLSMARQQANNGQSGSS